ncbi:MAG TPA: hypothetical protein VNZ45_07945, partial [Bacteroidia bacterium]|nr:hypothetical protein [Bacteroidia bacterium]
MNDDLIKRLVDWILDNRRGRAFKGYPANKIVNEVRAAIKQDVIAISTCNNMFSGVALGERNDDKKVIIIHDVLTTKPGVVK